MDQDATATLEDDPSARDLYALLPLDLESAGYATSETIAYLPCKLTEDGSGGFGDEAVGDLCHHTPFLIYLTQISPIITDTFLSKLPSFGRQRRDR